MAQLTGNELVNVDALKEVYDNIKESINILPNMSRTMDTTDSDADLDIVDGQGNVIVRFENGHVETKGFQSAESAQSKVTNGTDTDLDVMDEDGNVALRLAGGHIITKFFNSANVAPLYPWAGKTWAAIGDSLTEVNSRTTVHYHDYIAQLTGIMVNNLGHSGAGYYARPSDYTFRKQANWVPIDADVVTIFGSGNDVTQINNNTIALGDVTDTTADTMCGCINITLNNIYARIPAVNLGVITPTPWYRTSTSTDWTPETPENLMEQYCDAIAEICKRRSIPCLDLYHMSNLRPKDSTARALEYSKDDGDGVHPNELGHKLIASRFIEFLRSIMM